MYKINVLAAVILLAAAVLTGCPDYHCSDDPEHQHDCGLAHEPTESATIPCDWDNGACSGCSQTKTLYWGTGYGDCVDEDGNVVDASKCKPPCKSQDCDGSHTMTRRNVIDCSKNKTQLACETPQCLYGRIV